METDKATDSLPSLIHEHPSSSGLATLHCSDVESPNPSTLQRPLPNQSQKGSLSSRTLKGPSTFALNGRQRSSSSKQVFSILKPRSTNSPPKSNKPSDRKDTFGNPIGAGHKIVFAKKLTHVVLVENWSKYNSDSNLRNSCCQIF
jgi:hypothetical protein